MNRCEPDADAVLLCTGAVDLISSPRCIYSPYVTQAALLAHLAGPRSIDNNGRGSKRRKQGCLRYVRPDFGSGTVSIKRLMTWSESTFSDSAWKLSRMR